MNILQFLHFLVFLIYSYLLVLVLWKDLKSLLNRVCAALLACFAVWSFGSIYIYYNPYAIKDTVILFDNIGSLGWISFASFSLWFALIFTEKKKILKTKIIYPSIFALPLLLIYKQWTGFLTADYVHQPWGWENVWSESIWTYIFYLYYISFMIIVLYLLLNFERKTEEPIKKKQAKILFITALFSLVFGTLTDVIFTELNIYTLHLNSLGNVITLIWAFGMVYAIVKYKLMVITQVAAAENIISTMTDSLILLDRQGNIVSVNKATLDLSEYGKDELSGKSVELFFREKDFKNTLLEKAIKKETIENYELNFKTKTGDNVPVVFSSSTMMDEAGGIVGIVCIIKDITERKLSEEAIKKSQQEFDSLFRNSPEALVYLDEKGNFLDANLRFCELFGYSLAEIKGRNIDDGMIHPLKKIEEGKRLSVNALESYLNYETMRKKKDGTLFPVSISATPLLVDGQVKGEIGIYIDISERIKLQKALQESEEKYYSIISSALDAIFFIDHTGRITYYNQAAEKMFGYSEKEMLDKDLHQLIVPSKYHPDFKKGFAAFQETGEGPAIGNTLELSALKKTGEEFPVALSLSSVKLKDTWNAVGIIRDVSSQKEAEEKLEKLARVDSLTGCYNRGYGLELLDRQMKLSHRSKSPLLLAFLDIDGFKLINDNFGHDEGDRALKEVTGLFKSTLREIDIICRMGGDEFLLIFPDNSLKEAPLIKERLDKDLIRLNQTLKKPYQIDLSIGLSEYDPANPLTIDELIRIADKKMYEDKKNKKRKKE